VPLLRRRRLLSNLYNRELVENERRLESLALVLAEQIDRSFQSIELIQTDVIERMQSLGIASAEDFERQMSGYDTHRRLKDKISALPHISAIVLTNPQGKLINFSRSWPIPSLKVFDQDPSEVFKSDPQLTFFVGKPLRGPAIENWVVPIARKFTGPNGEFLGVVLGIVELRYFENVFKSIMPGEGSSISFFRNDGTLLVRYPRIEPIIGQAFRGCRFQKLDSSVPVMQSAQDCMGDDVPEALDRAPVRRILSERNMRTPSIVIGGEFRKDPPQVLFVEHDQMIGTLAPDRPDQAFNMPILPRRAE
jgi:hypothetical protein